MDFYSAESRGIEDLKFKWVRHEAGSGELISEMWTCDTGLEKYQVATASASLLAPRDDWAINRFDNNDYDDANLGWLDKDGKVVCGFAMFSASGGMPAKHCYPSWISAMYAVERFAATET